MARSPPQLAHAAFQPFKRHRHHCGPTKICRIIPIGLRVAPKPLSHGIDPQVIGPLGAGAFQPDLARLFVPMLVSRRLQKGDLVGRHRRIAHEDAFVVGAVRCSLISVGSGNLLGPTPAVLSRQTDS